jgi:4-amino-4-deoxy-L-arabinose transferase-like glycosyltransferase
MTITLGPACPSPAAATPPARSTRARWEWLALGLLLAATAALYLWDLGINGDGNAFYAAAVQAGTQNWTAFLFGSLDPSNFITVDKPPASLWMMALSGRIFGFSPWSMLVPDALMGVASIGLLYGAVRRVAGPVPGLVAGVVLALTPTAVLMFRFDNPDAMLVLLVVAAAYATVRAIEGGSTRWLVLAGVLLGFGFLSKMLQAFVVAPGLLLAYVWAAPGGLGRRIRQVLLAGGALVVAAGWWLVVEWLWPVADRPYIGGSTDNSSLELAFGYNGFGRILGGGHGGGFAGGAAGGRLADAARPVAGFARGGFGGLGGQAGATRMLGDAVGGQVAWLLPAAVLLLVAALWATRRAPRTDPTRASLLLWGGWTVACAVVFSFMQGIFHPYYTIEMAPGIAALIGIGGAVAWRQRTAGRITLAVAVALTAVWAFVLLDRTPTFLPWLRWAVLVVGVVAVLGLIVPAGGRRAGAVVVAVAMATGLAGPAAYAAETVGTAHTGGGVSAGPAATGRAGFGATSGRAMSRSGTGGTAGGTFSGTGRARDGSTTAGTTGALAAGASGFGAGWFGGGFGDRPTASPALVSMLKAAGTRWSAATVGSQGAAALELAGAGPVMAIGGFSGSDPAPTLQEFEQYVAAGDVRYFLGSTGGRGGRGTGGQIATWVQQHFTATTVGGQTVYDLSRPTA